MDICYGSIKWLFRKYDLAKKYLDLALAPLLKDQFQMGLMHIYSLYVKYYFDFSGDLKSGHDFFDKFEKSLQIKTAGKLTEYLKEHMTRCSSHYKR